MTRPNRRSVLRWGLGVLLICTGSLACWTAAIAQQPGRPQQGGLDLNNLDLKNFDLKNLQNLDLKNLDLKNLNLQDLDLQQMQGLLQKFKRKKYEFPYDNVDPGPPVPATMASIFVEFDPRLALIVPEARKTADVVGIPQGPSPDLGSPSGTSPNLGAPAPNLGNPQPNLGAPQPNLGPPQPNLGAPQPNPDAPAPKLGNPGPSLGPAVPNLGKPSASPDGEETAKPQAGTEGDKDGAKPPEPAPKAGDDLGPLIPIPQKGAATTKAPAEEPQPAERDNAAKQPTPIADEATEPPACFIVPGRHTTRVTGFRAMVANGEFGQPPAFPDRGAKDGMELLELRPVWHKDVPRFFHPAAGLHVFAIVHPFTHRTVCVQVYLPEGKPVVEVDRNDLAFVYGRYDIEIEFERDGRVDVKYGD